MEKSLRSSNHQLKARHVTENFRLFGRPSQHLLRSCLLLARVMTNTAASDAKVNLPLKK